MLGCGPSDVVRVGKRIGFNFFPGQVYCEVGGGGTHGKGQGGGGGHSWQADATTCVRSR